MVLRLFLAWRRIFALLVAADTLTDKKRENENKIT